jgi:hypothetical protein
MQGKLPEFSCRLVMKDKRMIREKSEKMQYRERDDSPQRDWKENGCPWMLFCKYFVKTERNICRCSLGLTVCMVEGILLLNKQQ